MYCEFCKNIYDIFLKCRSKDKIKSYVYSSKYIPEVENCNK